MKNPRHKQKNMKRKYIIADGESGSFDTLRAAKLHLSFYSDKEYNEFVGCFIVGYKKNSDEIISLTEIKENRKFGKTAGQNSRIVKIWKNKKI